MATAKSKDELRALYEKSAEEFFRRTSGEVLGESVGQGKQREISLGSLAVLKVYRSDLHTFNDLPVRYSVPGRRSAKEIVPDQFVVLSSDHVHAKECFDISDSVGPFRGT